MSCFSWDISTRGISVFSKLIRSRSRSRARNSSSHGTTLTAFFHWLALLFLLTFIFQLLALQSPDFCQIFCNLLFASITLACASLSFILTSINLRFSLRSSFSTRSLLPLRSFFSLRSFLSPWTLILSGTDVSLRRSLRFRTIKSLVFTLSVALLLNVRNVSW